MSLPNKRAGRLEGTSILASDSGDLDADTPIAFRPARAEDSEEAPSDESRATLVAIHAHNVTLDNAPTVPRFAWNQLAAGEEASSRRFRLFRGRSGSSLGRSRMHTSIDWNRLFFDVIAHSFMLLLTWFWVAYMLVCCGLVVREDNKFMASIILGFLALVTYVIFFCVVWIVVAPIANGSYRLLLSSRRRRQLEHQFELTFPAQMRTTPENPDEDALLDSDQLPRHRLSASEYWKQRQSHTVTPVNANVARAQSALGALPLLIWSAQAGSAARMSADTRRHTEQEKIPAWQAGGRLAASPVPPPTTPPSQRRAGSAAGPGMQNVLHAISQPDIGFGERRGTARIAGAGRLPQIREERAREAGKLFSESDWQALLDVEAKEGEPRSFLREWLKSRHRKLHRVLVHVTQMPTFTVSVILRNVIWAGLYVWAVNQLHRQSFDHPWDYSTLPMHFHWLENIFQWQLTLDYVLLFLAASEKWRYFVSPAGIVDLITLPVAQSTIQTVSHRYYPYFSLTFGAIRLFRLFRLEKLIGDVFPSIDTVRLIILGLMVDTTVVVLTFACSMYIAEAPRGPGDFDQVLDYVYYSIVTMTTVGYGDYSPQTRRARWITSAAILLGFIIFPYHVQRLLTALHIPPVCVGRMPSMSSDFVFVYGKMRPRQLGVLIHNLAETLPGSIRHILVVTPFPAISFKPLTLDFARKKAIKICVSQKCPSSEEMQLYCALARAVIIVADPKAANQPYLTSVETTSRLLAEDQKAFLKLTKAQPWCWPTVPITVQLAHGLYSDLTTEIGAYHVVSLEQLKLRCIGKTVSGCPGFIPLIFNLFHAPSSDSMLVKFFENIERRTTHIHGSSREQRTNSLVEGEERGENEVTIDVELSSSDSEGAEMTLKDRVKSWRRGHVTEDRFRTSATDQEDRALQNEMNFYYFFRGLRYQVYRMDFPACMRGVDFSLAVRLIYRRFQLFLIGLVTVDKKFYLNPVGYKIGVEVHPAGSNLAGGLAFPVAGVVLAPSLHDVVRVTKLKSFHVAKQMADTEAKFNTRNHRSPEDLKHALNAFLETVNKHKASESSATNHKSLPLPKGFLDHMPGSSKRSSWDIRRFVNPGAQQDEVEDAARPDEPVIKEVNSAVEAFDLAHKNERSLIVCCGWPKDLHALLTAIEAGRPSYLIVLAAAEGPAFVRWGRDLEPFAQSCAWVQGSPLSIEDLKNAGVLLADAVIILSTQHAMGDDPSQTGTPVDNQVVLVRQQLFALFARVKEYLKTLDLDEESEPKISRFRVPLIFTELQERENVEYLSSPKDLFLLSAFRNISKHDGFQSRTLVTHLSGQDHADDAEWAAEGGRDPDTAHNALKYSVIRSPLDFSHYAIQSEYRAGRLWLREMTYPLVGFSLPISRYAIDTSIIEHLVDGTHSPLADFVRGKKGKTPALSKYRCRSPLSLIAVPRIFNAEGTVFRDVFSYLMKVELKLVIAVLRSIKDGPLRSANPIEYLRGSEANELLISCPAPTMPLTEGDRLYVLSACPKHTCGLFYCEK